MLTATRLTLMAAAATVYLSTSAFAKNDQAETGKEQEVDATSKTATETKPAKITDRSDPNYIRCRSERVIGSLVKKRKKCMTNAEWKVYNTEGNRIANELVDESRSTSMPAG